MSTSKSTDKTLTSLSKWQVCQRHDKGKKGIEKYHLGQHEQSITDNQAYPVKTTWLKNTQKQKTEGCPVKRHPLDYGRLHAAPVKFATKLKVASAMPED